MALTVFKNPQGDSWPLGFVGVPVVGTPVNIMNNVDPAFNNAPWTATGPGLAAGPEYTPRCHQVTFQGLKPGANNNGMVYNSGQVYILRYIPANNNGGAGPGNRADSGAMLYVLPQGGSVTIQEDYTDQAPVSPYLYQIDADNNNDGALITLLGCRR